MYINKLTLLNIRSYDRLDMEFSKGINLLVGNNNSGKSTIIKAIYKLQNVHSINQEDIRTTKDFARILVDINDISREDALLFSFHDVEQRRVPASEKVAIQYGLYTDIHNVNIRQESYYFDPGETHSIDKMGKVIFPVKQDKDRLTEFFGLPNAETKNSFIYPFFSKRKTNYYSKHAGGDEAFYIGEDLSNITSKIGKISNPSHEKYEEFMRLVKDILGFGIGVIPYKEKENNTGIFVTSSKVIPVEKMGEGVVNILGLIVILLTEDNKLFLIEELENDIHPQALKKLLNLIVAKSQNNQFVISTHSNIVVKYLGVDPAKTFHITWQPFEKEGKDKIPTSHVTEVGNDPLSKLNLLESLGYELFDFDLYSSYLIFEESSAERIVRDFLIPEFAPGLLNKVKTHAASGASDLELRFHSFLSLFVFVHQNPIYYQKVWVFADGDDEGKKAVKSLRKKFPTWPEKHFTNFSKSNLEDYYPATFKKQVEQIGNTRDKQKKRQLKIELTNKVIDWCLKNKGTAKKEFAVSAAEIIDYLKQIETKI